MSKDFYAVTPNGFYEPRFNHFANGVDPSRFGGSFESLKQIDDDEYVEKEFYVNEKVQVDIERNGKWIKASYQGTEGRYHYVKYVERSSKNGDIIIISNDKYIRRL